MSGAVVPVRRARRKAPVQVGNVVSLHAPKETTEDIIKSVRDRSRKQNEAISAQLEELVRAVDQRHMKRARDCVPIGYAMKRPELDDWIEIGQRMLANGGGR